MLARRRGLGSVLSEPHKGCGNLYLLLHLPGMSDLLRLSVSRQGATGCLCAGQPGNLLLRLKTSVGIRAVSLAQIRSYVEQAAPLKPAPGLQPAVWSPLSGTEGQGWVGTCYETLRDFLFLIFIFLRDFFHI